MIKNILGIELCDKLTRKTDWNAPTVELIQAIHEWETMCLRDIVARLPGHTLYRIANLFSIGENEDAKTEYKNRLNAAAALLQESCRNTLACESNPQVIDNEIDGYDNRYLNEEKNAVRVLRIRLRDHILAQIED